MSEVNPRERESCTDEGDNTPAKSLAIAPSSAVIRIPCGEHFYAIARAPHYTRCIGCLHVWGAVFGDGRGLI